MAAVTDPGILAAYQQAASVQSETGVDPSIVATILSTEGGSTPGRYSLGITTGAPGGRGSSGIVLPGSGIAGQPSAFWGYRDGAEAARALAQYLRTGPPGIQALAPYANDPAAFFAAGPQVYAQGLSGNYYVPTSAEASSAGGVLAAVQHYWSGWAQRAQQLADRFGTSFDPSPGGQFGGPIGAISMPGGPTPPGTPRTPAEANPCAAASEMVLAALPGGGQIKAGPIGEAFCRINHLIQVWSTPGTWWTIGLAGAAMVAILIGALIILRPELPGRLARA